MTDYNEHDRFDAFLIRQFGTVTPSQYRDLWSCWLEARQDTEADAQRLHRAEREARATHVCAVCEARWIDNSVFGDGDMWSLASEDCGKCCDNDRMDRPNIIKMPWYERLTSD